MAQLPASLMQAARVQAARNATAIRKIVLPLVAGTAIATFFMSFTALPAGESHFFRHHSAHLQQLRRWAQGSALSVVTLILVFGS